MLTLNAADPRHPRALLVDGYGLFMDFLEAAPGPASLGALPVEIVAGANGENDARVTIDAGHSVLLGFDRLQGIFSLDGVSLSATSNALLADLALATLDSELGPSSAHPLWLGSLPRLALREELQADAFGPVALLAAQPRLQLPSLVAYADTSATPPLQATERCALWRPQPDSTRCPANLSFAQGAFFDLVYGQQAVVTVLALDREGLPLRHVAVAARAAHGAIAQDYVLTDDEGQARFRYSAPLEGTNDELRAFCGAARQHLRVRLGVAPTP